MNDDSMVKIMQSLDLDYSKAISSTLQFQESIGSLNKQLESMKKIAMQSAKEINNAFSSQLGNVDTGFLKEYNKMFSNLEKQNKPIEVKVETDKAEIKMQKFAESMGIRLDKNLRGKFKGLASNLLGDFDQSQFDDLAANISMSYQKAMDKQNQKMQASMFAQSDDKKIYDYLNKATIKLDESTVRAKKNVDGFSHAIRNLAKQSETSGSSLDQMAQEMEGMGISGFGANTEDIAARMTKAVNSVRDFRNGMVDLGSSVPTAEIEQFTRDALSNLIVDLNKVQLESKEVTASLQGIGTSQESMESIGTITNSLKGEIKELGVVTTKTFKDMNNEAYKYIDTYKSLERGVSVSDTYIKNDQGSFDFQGRVVDDKSVELTYRNIQKAHTEALKLNAAFDQTIVKNQQLAQSDYWKSQFQNVSKTSDEIKALNNYYAKEEKQSAINMEKKHAEALKMNKARDAEIAKIKESNIEQMKAQAASVQQRTATKGLSEEYGRQASMLREQLAIIQNRLQTEGKLTAEEVRQTNQIKEQLNLLRSQTKAAISDDIREHPSTMGDEFARRTSWFLTGSIFYGAINSAKKATAAIKEVEGGITDISRVMNDSRFVFEEYRDELMKLGVDYGYTFETTQDVAMRWAQAGYNVVDSLELTETALAALNAAQLDSETATQGLIAIMSQWNIEATDLMEIGRASCRERV